MDPESPHTPQAAPAAAWTALAAITLLGVWLRWPGLWTGYAPDEFANIIPGGIWGQITDPESAVNPPLLRLLTNPWFSSWVSPQVGRAISTICSVVTIPLTWWLARRGSRSEIGALFAALLIAVAPPAVMMGTRFRSYAAFGAALAWHLIALSHSTDQPSPWRAQAAVSAVLMVWLHYLAIPVIALTVVLAWLTHTRRDLWTLYLPAALTIAPMGWLVLTVTETRVGTPDSVWQSLSPILALGLPGYPPLTGALHGGARGIGVELPDAMAAVVALLALLSIAAWPRQNPTARLLILGMVALLLAIFGMSTVQFVRSPVAVMLLGFLAPLLATLVALIPTAPGRLLTAALLALLLGADLHRRHPDLRSRDPEASLVRFASTWHDWDEARGDLPILLWPTYAFSGLHLYLTQEHIRQRNWQDPRCPDEGCYVHEDTVFLPLKNPDDPPRGLVVAFQQPEPGMLEDCTRLHEEWVFHVWRCGDEP